MIKDLLVKTLKLITNDLELDKIDCLEDLLLLALDILLKANVNRELSKEEACRYLNLSRSTFDTYIRNGWIPKGEKHLGFKELSWKQSDLDIAVPKIRKMLENSKL